MKQSVDIVLLPSKEIMDLSYETNKKIIENGGNRIIFKEKSYVPHMSLLMGVIDGNDLEWLISRTKEIAMQTKGLDLIINSLEQSKLHSGENYYCFNIDKTREVIQLRESIFSSLQPLMSYDPTFDTFYKSDTLDPIIIDRVRTFENKEVKMDKNLHITLWIWGDVDIAKVMNVPLTWSKLAIYQLGNYCTCAKEIATFELT